MPMRRDLREENLSLSKIGTYRTRDRGIKRHRISICCIGFIIHILLVVEASVMLRHNDRLEQALVQPKFKLNELFKVTQQSLFNESTSASTLVTLLKTKDIETLKIVANNSNSLSTPLEAEEEIIGDGLCTLQNVLRASSLKNSEVVERALKCSKIDELNYKQVLKDITRISNSSIQQIEITESNSSAIFLALGLICDQLDCSKITVFNITGQDIHEHNVLSSWISLRPQLEVLDLSSTSLGKIEMILQVDDRKPILMSNLTTLVLDYNDICELSFDFLFKQMPKLKHLSLINNSIFDIDCKESLRNRIESQLQTISLAGNALNCDKSKLWFMKKIQDQLSYPKFPDYEQIRCSSPERLVEMTWNQRVSVLETIICESCECKSMKRTAISVDCHNKNMTKLPDILPINTKILNLTSNRISNLAVPANSKNWENVTYIHLKNNSLTSFMPLEKDSKLLRNLAAIDVRMNKFQEFPSHIFEQFINLDQVHLSNNPWLCDCEITFAFQEWLQRQFHKVGDKEEIKCGISGTDNNGLKSNSLQQRLSGRVIYRLSKSELCPQDNLEEPYDWLDLLNIIIGVTILLILTKVTLDYMYQHRTKRLPHFFKLNY